MSVLLKNQAIENILNGRVSKGARKTSPQDIGRIAAHEFDFVESPNELRLLPGNRLESLVATSKVQYSICFKWAESGLFGVEIIDYHWRYIMVRIPVNRELTHPGEMLAEECLKPMKITQRELTDAIHVPLSTG